jgi:DNA-binding IclR family transcriptional regulator
MTAATGASAQARVAAAWSPVPAGAGSDGKERGVAAPGGEPAASARYGTVKSADRTVELLELLAMAERRLTLTELHRELNYPKSSLFMLLQTLVARGWVEADRDRTAYGIGVRALLVGTSYLDHDPVVRVAVRVLERMRDQVDGTFHLARLDGPDVVYLASRGSRHHLPRASRLGRRAPAASTALGKILLAQRPWAEVDALLPVPLPPLTPRTVTDRVQLRAQLARVRAGGYSFDREENTPGLCCFGVAVATRAPVVDALGCSVPLERLTDQYGRQVVEALLTGARQLTDLLRRNGLAAS